MNPLRPCQRFQFLLVIAVSVLMLASSVAGARLATTSPASAQETPTEAPTPEPTEEPTPEPTPEPTEEPTREPTREPTEEATAEPEATEEVLVTEEDEGDDGGIGALGIILIAGAVVLGIVLVAAFLASRRQKAAVAGDWDAQLKASLGEARWIHDTLSMDIANRATSRGPGELERLWREGQRRISDLEAALFRLSSNAPENRRDVPVPTLTEALRGLRQALETDVALRGDAEPRPGQETLLQDSSALISQRRAELAAAIQALQGP